MQLNIASWRTSSAQISINMPLRMKDFIFFFHRHFNRNYVDENMSIVVPALLGSVSKKLETLSWFHFVRIESKWNDLIAPWAEFYWCVFDFWSADKDRVFSTMRVMPRATEPTVCGTVGLLPPMPCTNVIAAGLFGTHLIISRCGMASFWKSRGVRFHVYCIDCLLEGDIRMVKR